ncbi:MAG: DNA-directed RNA polymerase subunit delta [Bacilli bacterium]
MATKSNLLIAYELLKECHGEEVLFDVIWDHVCEEQAIDDENKIARKARFYTNLSLDGRFVLLSDNKWALRENEPFDKVHIDMQAVYADVGDDYDDDDEKKSDDDDDIEGEPEDLEENSKKVIDLINN